LTGHQKDLYRVHFRQYPVDPYLVSRKALQQWFKLM
jgi:hypothetical protein